MSDRTPWWYSGDEEPERVESPSAADPADAPPDAPDGSSMDWGALLSGAARMVDWATSSVMAPHAEHEDPADHPQCVVCRTILLVGDPTGLLARPSPDAAEATDAAATLIEPDLPPPAPRIRWIPIVDGSTDDSA